MNLETFLRDGRLQQHQTSHNEIKNLMGIVNRDIADAQVPQLSADRRFITAYNAALQLSTVLLRAYGYRTKGGRSGHHWVTFGMLIEILGDDGLEYSNYFDACRIKRNISDYDSSGEISDSEAKEIIAEVLNFKKIVEAWLSDKPL